jgi:transcription elongation factor Elf1
MNDLTIRSTTDPKARVLASKLKAKIPGFSCPTCGHRDFALLEQPELGLRTWLNREDQPFAPIGQKTTQPLVTLVCTNCGHIEQFAEAVVEGVDPSLYGEDRGNG